MKYFIDTEFLEGPQYYRRTFIEALFATKRYTEPTIDLISIGIVAEDGREYYAISKDFNLMEAWNRCEIKEANTSENHSMNDIKVYWIRENILRSIFIELLHKEFPNAPTFYNKYNIGNMITNDEVVLSFDYKHFKYLIKKYEKSNKQIAKEIKDFCTVGTAMDKLDRTGNLITFVEYNKHIQDLIDKWNCTYVFNEVPEFFAYYADYDWVVFCWLFGRMIDLPNGFPMYCKDLKQMLDDKADPNGLFRQSIPIVNIGIYRERMSKEQWVKAIKLHTNYPKQENVHNALDDARWDFKLYKFLNKL